MKKLIAGVILCAMTFLAHAKDAPITNAVTDKDPCFVVFGLHAININLISSIYYLNSRDGYIVIERAVGRGYDTNLRIGPGQSPEQAFNAVTKAVNDARAKCNLK